MFLATYHLIDNRMRIGISLARSVCLVQKRGSLSRLHNNEAKALFLSTHLSDTHTVSISVVLSPDNQ